MKQIRTDRLLLRAFTVDDLADFYAYAKKPTVGPNAGWRPHRNHLETQAVLQDFIAKGEVWGIVYKVNNKLIGSIGFHEDKKRQNRQAKMLGYVLDDDYWGQGLATEAAQAAVDFAFSELNLNLISAYHYPFNARSQRVIEKCGFQYEGCLRQATQLYDGNIYDDLCYSLSRQDYVALGNK